MTYSLIFSKTAENHLKKLEKPIQERLLLSLERIRVRPYDFVKQLVGYPYYKLRVGDYRVILDIQNEKLIILVIEIGHRKNIYKRMH